MKKIPFFLWLIFLIVVTFLPSTSIPQVKVGGIDKVSHLFLFAVLTLFIFFGFGERSWKILISIGIFAVLDEVLQYYVPGRVVNFYDLFFNLSGIGLAFWVLS